MAGSGTGVPLTFRCAKCQSKTGWRATGQTLQRRSTGVSNPRKDQLRVYGYRCKCGHSGWSRHYSVRDAWVGAQEGSDA